MTIKSFVNKHGITLAVETADNNPNMDEWKGAQHYKVTLQRKTADNHRRAYTLYFSHGSARSDKPTAESVIECLQADQSCEYNTFEEFCAEFGYSNDSRKAERTYNAIIKQCEKLEKFLGFDLLDELKTANEDDSDDDEHESVPDALTADDINNILNTI